MLNALDYLHVIYHEYCFDGFLYLFTLFQIFLTINAHTITSVYYIMIVFTIQLHECEDFILFI